MRASLVFGLLVVGVASTQEPDSGFALALVRHQASTKSYMTSNRFSYRVTAATEIPAETLREAAGSDRAAFVSAVSDVEGRNLDLSDMRIQAPRSRPDGDYDVDFSFSTCLRSGEAYGWSNAAVMRRDADGWQVLSVAWTGHWQGECAR